MTARLSDADLEDLRAFLRRYPGIHRPRSRLGGLERMLDEVLELRELLELVYPFVAESSPAEVNGVAHAEILRRLRVAGGRA